MRTDRVPGLGIVKGIWFAFRQVLRPKVTVQYPEVVNDISPRHRGRLILLYDEAGTLKCETCFQCAAACPIECIDMGGVDTRDRYHVHWGPPEQYAERREESALRRSGRPVPDRTFDAFEPIDLAPLDAHPRRGGLPAARASLTILERTQDAYGHLPVAALQHIAHQTGAWYSELYGIATSYPHLRFEPPERPRRAASAAARSAPLWAAAACWPPSASTSARTSAACSPDGAVRLETTDCHGESSGSPRVEVDGQLLPRSSAEDAAPHRQPPCAPTSRRGCPHEPAHPGRCSRAGRPCSWPRATQVRPRGRHRGGRGGRRLGRPIGRASTERSPEAVIRIVSEAGLRGRGGAGYPAGRKWRDCAGQPGGERHVVANGFEADPGAQVDRTLMELDPHAVVEGVGPGRLGRAGPRRPSSPCAPSATAGRRAPAAGRRRRRGARATSATTPWARGIGCTSRCASCTGAFVVGEETVLLRALESTPRAARPASAVPVRQQGLWGRADRRQQRQDAGRGALDRAPRRGRLPARSGHPDGAGHDARPAGRRRCSEPGIVEVPSGTPAEVLDGRRRLRRRQAQGRARRRPVGRLPAAEALDTPSRRAALHEAGALVGSGSAPGRRRARPASSTWPRS